MPLKNYSKGARKALSAMQKTYGKKKGTSIFYAKANKFNGGAKTKNMRIRAGKTYSKGSRLKIK